MKSNTVATKYAKALFDVTYQNGKSGEVATQLLEISKAFDKNMLAFFENPVNVNQDKISVIKNALEGKASLEILNFMALLIENNRVGLISEISREYSIQVQAAAGITKGKMFSAIKLEPTYVQEVEAAVSKSLGRKVELSFEKDDSLIAGYKVQVGGWTFDGSINSQLKTLKEELMKRGL